ncbi:glucosamine-6-phosphate deaminase [Edaphobacter albus]|uniref:glucosamine-6-phosphate deaminase n=1 Tax=Edaphobacter sp. 4G125 TaxID=2763071 RepID=UPI001647D81D|nr:glucosamine-6-phosphate deaminase [Edaphobacter sp. 4G125]QNI37359.1 glucosamine-6-phosphate deaminase [Edaphobacter sp. 4G125]
MNTTTLRTSMDIRIADTRVEMGRLAASDIADALRKGLQQKSHLRIVLAAAPSQSEMLSALIAKPYIDWSRITAFHMDEYVGLPSDAPQRFGNWLRKVIFDRVPFAAYHLIEPGDDPAAASRQYASKLAEAPIDFVLLGIGANGHLAFNDPPANLEDPLAVKEVELDEICRQQQVDDDCFATISDVPRKAISLTVPTLLSGQRLFCCVPGANKSAAVKAMVEYPISGEWPATALRTHPHCTIYLDRESSARLNR